ncbi:MAG: hypothetical protein IPN24_20655 [Betaproteobacteria bacterium]|nr:hypothetical protein [Betaproteobacteria bacterium]
MAKADNGQLVPNREPLDSLAQEVDALSEFTSRSPPSAASRFGARGKDGERRSADAAAGAQQPDR